MMMTEYQGYRSQWFGHITYSTCGEDKLIKQLFWLMNIQRPSYLDIGAHHPFHLSNTALLYSLGSRGVNVEANPNLMEEFRIHRPEDINVCIGVALQSGLHKFYMWDDMSGRNTFSEEASKKMEQLTKTIELPCTTLENILHQYCDDQYPDFLSIDIEGMDYDILEDADFSKTHPKVICAEVLPEETQKFVKLMRAKGYEPVTRLSWDLIFIRKELKDACSLP